MDSNKAVESTTERRQDMGYGPERAAMEYQLARAHRALHTAFMAADNMGDRGAAEDCWQLMVELARVAEKSLKGTPRAKPQIKGQTHF